MQAKQCKNSQSVVEWFKNIWKNNNASFIVFDIERFYPSISPELFHKAINFVKTIRAIPDKELCNLDERCDSMIKNIG